MITTPTTANAAQQDDEWSRLQSLISPYYGEWNDTSYNGLFVPTMPKTALLGNGDIGVASGGDAESKSFYVSKGDFWAYRGSPLPIGGVTIQKESGESQDPQTTSLAYGKPATSSADHPGFPASRAVNGQWAPGYEGWVSPVGNPQWLAVDLQQPTTFNRFVLRHDAAARPNQTPNVTQNFKLQTSDDGSSWTDVYTVTGNHSAISDIVLPHPVTSRYVRVYVSKGTQETTDDSRQNPRARIGQFELYNNPDLIDGEAPSAPDAPDQPVSLTLNKTATASGSHYNLTPDRAVNGEWSPNSGYEGWTSGYRGDDQPGPWWLEVDLGAATAFNRFVVQHDGAARPSETENNTKDFELQARSSSDDDWTVVYSVTGNSASTTDIALPETVTARYVRLYITAGTQGNTDDSRDNPRARIGQFELYNMPASSDGDSDPTDPTDQTDPTEPGDVSKMYDLGGAYDIARYVVRLSQAQNVKVEASLDGTAWRTVGTTPNAGDKVVDVTTDGFKARYIHVTADRASDIRQLSLFATPGLVRAQAVGSLHEIQDIVNAEIRTDMDIADTPLSMRTWTAATENVIVTELTSNGDEPVSLQARLWAKSGNAAAPVSASDDGDAVTVTRRTTIDSQDAADTKAHVSKAAMTMRLVGTEPVSAGADADQGTGTLGFVLNPGQTIYIVTAVGGGGRTYDYTGALLRTAEPEAQADALLAGLTDKDSIQRLLDAHRAWWKNFWLTSYVTMDTSDPKLNTLMKYYYAAQYILGSSIREDKVAPGLYSLWHTTDSSQWSSDYHLNYNFIATFYGVNSSNRTWMGLPAVDAILDYAGEGERNAASTDHLMHIGEGAQGQQVRDFVQSKIDKGDIDPTNGIPNALLYPVSIGPWGMKIERSYSYYGQLLDAIFSAYPLMEYYDYTLDDAFLPTLYDYLQKCIALYGAWLEKEDGKYVLYSAYNEGSWGKNSAVELALLKNALGHVIKASEKLNVDADKRAEWQDMLANLAPQPTAQYDGKTIFSLAEKHWNNNQWEDLDRPIPWDGNILPMENVIPGEQVGYYSPASDLQIADNTIDVFVDEAIGGGQNGAWSQYNNFPKIFANAVRVRYPAQQIVDNFALTIEEQMQSNLTIKDDSDFHGAEKSGATEAINSMMLLSDQGVMKVFPNWLNDKDASFARLRAKDAFVVSSAYSGETREVQYVDLVSEAGKPVTIASPWASGVVVKNSRGQVVSATRGAAPNHEEEATYTFATTAGESYHLTKAETNGNPGNPRTPSNPGNGGGDAGANPPAAGTPGSGVLKTPQPQTDASGLAAAAVGEAELRSAADASGAVRIEVPAAPGATGYALTLPASAFAAGKLTIATPTGTVSLGAAPNAADLAGKREVTLRIETAALPGQEPSGGRPAVKISLEADGAAIEWNDPDAPLAVSIPYAPTDAELADAEHLVIQRADGEGGLTAVPTGKYDAAAGAVVFRTTTLGVYAIGYVHKTFRDIGNVPWAGRAIEVLASKGVVNGTSADAFAPTAPVRRADFILMLVRALGLSASTEGNFADVNPDAYYADAVATAKQLGIASGSGANRFAPDEAISRQDMMTLIARALDTVGKAAEAGAEADLAAFADRQDVSPYAEQSVAALIRSGIVAGDGAKLNPHGTATRAETATLIYRIYNR